MHRTTTSTVVSMIVVCIIVGCKNNQVVDTDRMERIARLAYLPYPADVPFGPDLDVVVTRGKTTLRLHNRSVTDLRNVQLWINQQYVAHVHHIPVTTGGTTPGITEGLPILGKLSADDIPIIEAVLHGQSGDLQIPLEWFINQHGETYPVVGFLAPEKAFPVMIVEAYLPDVPDGPKRHRFNVRGEKRRY